MHTQPTIFDYPEFIVQALPANSDNFMYLIIDKGTRETLAVDPVDPDLLLHHVNENRGNMTRVLTTHHHWDHAGGNGRLAKMKPGLEFIGGDERIDAINSRVKHGEMLNFGANLKILCLATPCHTTGHICYYIHGNSPDSRVVFTGDTLFIGGCGRFFEGTATEMHEALNKILGKLPGNTSVFCGHEYTVQNLKYGLHVEPNNEAMRKKMEWAQAQRAQRLPTVPSTIDQEKLHNPFMRVDQRSVQEHTGTIGDEVATMAALRKEKDRF
ncbi:unnamed protein product [Cyprideis torosa]|uniref:hydroxyacylglutathione hydrolase n=1 Tax=Cyprideis torosa TaxID=163714 RepID=A0A7R8WGH9_9CRUS|nr:unnamed protein product [Cyprideis torosa]CAG0896657.1 unnamed protein product [Cyprideis torosa]